MTSSGCSDYYDSKGGSEGKLFKELNGGLCGWKYGTFILLEYSVKPNVSGEFFQVTDEKKLRHVRLGPNLII